MNDLGTTLLEVALRGLGLTIFGAIFCLATRRRSPASGAVAALSTLTGLSLLVALAPSPWPRWWSVNPATIVRETDAHAASGPLPERVLQTRRSVADEAASHHGFAVPVPRSEPPAATYAAAFVQAFQMPTDRPATLWGWKAWMAAAYTLGVAASLVHLTLGLWVVARVCRRSKPVEDASLIELVNVLRGEMDIGQTVAVRESSEVGTPATVGWRRPALLLPGDWSSWNESERIAILAHELAHVRRGDYAAGVWARVCVALQFYQPLAHWLAGWLRLQQELAADSWGAALSGGPRSYLQTLARLALGRDLRAPAWPARAFLPIRGTLTRRIEMLRDAKMAADPTTRRGGRWLTIATLSLAGLVVAGIRGPEVAIAQDRPAGRVAQRGAGLDLATLPSDVGMVLAARPGALLGLPGIKGLLGSFGPQADLKQHLGLDPNQMEQVVLAWLAPAAENRPRSGPMLPPPSAIIVRMAGATDWTRFAANITPNPEEVTHAGQKYVRNVGGGNGAPAYAKLDDRTVLIGISDGELRRYLSGRVLPNPRHAWDDALAALPNGQVALALDSAFILRVLDPVLAQPNAAPYDMFSPLWTKAFAHALSLDADKNLTLDYVATGSTEEGAGEVAKTVEALVTLAKNALPGIQKQTAEGPRAAGALVGLGGEVARTAKVEREGKTVRLHAASESDMASIVKNVLAPANEAARAAARRTQSVNNMKQIMLAMHNYASAHDGQFPPAVVMGPDGKTPHSWRVELLPYLEQDALYREYRMDEPWDSPANRKVLETRPAIFAYPGSDIGKSDSSYFVLTGRETMFPPDSKGTKLLDITDGTSNTIAIVEAKREIPWTKPEDIPIDMSGPLPSLGGYLTETPGFSAGFADGSVRFIHKTVNPTTLRALITRAAGEVIPSQP